MGMVPFGRSAIAAAGRTSNQYSITSTLHTPLPSGENAMTRARDRDPEPGESRFDFQEWLSAVANLAAVLLGAVLILGAAYLLVAAR